MQEAFDLAKRNDHGVVLSRVPNGIGWVWREIGDLSKAITFNRDASRSRGGRVPPKPKPTV